MPNDDKRIQKSTRQYYGQSAAEFLVNWLNFTEDRVGRARIIALLNASLRAAYLESATEHKIIRGKDGSYREERTPELEILEAAKDKLERMLAYYSVVPSIVIPYTAQKGPVPLEIGWESAPGSKLARHSNSVPRPGLGKRWLIKVLELIKSGLISKLATCRCSKFYFRKFAHQRFCSQKCKLVEFRSNEEVRAKRNEYARKLYLLHKSGKVK